MKEDEMYQKLHDAKLPYPIPVDADVKPYFEAGVIAKENLEDGQYYFGLCRNARIAVWNKPKQMFHHLRCKFGQWFMEDIKHPEDEKRFDVFVPFEKIER